MSKFSLLFMGGAVGLLCAGSPAAMAQAMSQNVSKTSTSPTKSPDQIPKEGKFSYKAKNPSGKMLTLDVSWNALSQSDKDGNARISGGAKYKHPDTGSTDTVNMDETRSYLTKEGKLFFAFHAFGDKVFGPVDIVGLERKRVESKKTEDKTSAPRTTGDKRFSKMTEDADSAEKLSRFSDKPSNESIDSNLEEEMSDGDISKDNLGTKDTRYPGRGSFDDVLIFNGTLLLPVSINWKTIEPIRDGYARVKGGLVLYDGEGGSAPPLDLTNAYLRSGKIHYSSPKLRGKFTSPVNVTIQNERVEAVKNAIRGILNNKGKEPPSFEAPYQSVDPLSGVLYQTLLDYGVQNFKYGRSDDSKNIREWLTRALDPNQSGDMSARVSSVLYQLGVKIKPGKVLNVALRPIEISARTKSLASSMAYPSAYFTLPLFVAGLEEIANIVDNQMYFFTRRANAVYRGLRDRRPVATADDVLDRLGLYRQQRLIANGLARNLGGRGILTVIGLYAVQRDELAQAFIDYWQDAEGGDPAEEANAADRIRAMLLRLMGRNNEPAVRIANVIVNRIRMVPLRDRNFARLYLTGLMAFANRPNNDRQVVGSHALFSDFSLHDEL